MGLFRFTVGILGAILIVGAFTSFVPLVLLGGLATGSVGFAFAFPIALFIVGAAMVYYGFYYQNSGNTHSTSKSLLKIHPELLELVKWGLLHALAIWLAAMGLQRLNIANTLLIILLTAATISLIAQIVRSVDSEFSLRWFTFYFLIQASIYWLVVEFLLPAADIRGPIVSAIAAGFVIAGIEMMVRRQRVRRETASWAMLALVIILLIANLGSVPGIEKRVVRGLPPSNSTASFADQDSCPSPTGSLTRSQLAFANGDSVAKSMDIIVNNSIWRVESEMKSCYLGKYRGQYPEWIYCDDMIVSRWERSGDGTIDYRWYTAVTAEWQPSTDTDLKSYTLNRFSCSNGQRVIVNKDTKSYYVHVSRDGTKTTIEY